MPKNYYFKVYGYGIGLLVSLVVFGLAFNPAHAQAQTVVEENMTWTTRDGVDSTNFGMVYQANADTVGVNGLDLLLVQFAPSSGTFTVEIYETNAGGATLGTLIDVSDAVAQSSIIDGTYFSANCNLGAGPVDPACMTHFDFPTGVNFTNGDYYAFIIRGSYGGGFIGMEGNNGSNPLGTDPRWDTVGSCTSSSCGGASQTSPFFILTTSGGGGPSYDGNPNTHVMRITEPELYSIVSSTSTPFTASFDAHISQEPFAEIPDFYLITYKKDLSYEYVEQYGNLYDDGWNGTDADFTISTTSLLTTGGTWNMSVVLLKCQLNIDGPQPACAEGNISNPADYGTVGPYYSGHRFSVLFEDNVSHTVESFGYVIYDASSCEIDFTDFNFGDCMGYLFQPPPDAFNKYQTLTLATRFPFSYIYQFDDITTAVYNQGSVASSSISTTVEGFGTITFISYDMVDAVPFGEFIKTLIRAFIWFLVGYTLYRMIIKMYDTQTEV